MRGHWRIENQLHWVLDVVFKDDLSQLRKDHGAKNMAVVRHFAINLIRAAKDKQSIKLQTAPQGRRMGPKLSRKITRRDEALTRIRSPGICR